MQIYMNCSSNLSYFIISCGIRFFVSIKSNGVYSSLFLLNINYYFLIFNSEFMYLLIVFVICIEYKLFGFPYFNSKFMYSLD
jgi:hypothetical protein